MHYLGTRRTTRIQNKRTRARKTRTRARKTRARARKTRIQNKNKRGGFNKGPDPPKTHPISPSEWNDDCPVCFEKLFYTPDKNAIKRIPCSHTCHSECGGPDTPLYTENGIKIDYVINCPLCNIKTDNWYYQEGNNWIYDWDESGDESGESGDESSRESESGESGEESGYESYESDESI